MVPGPFACHSFLHRITTAGETHEVENAGSFAKIIMICENNYSC